jgi:hypothetical protein
MKKFIAASLMLAMMLIGSFSVGNENVEVVAQDDDDRIYDSFMFHIAPPESPVVCHTPGGNCMGLPVVIIG